MFIPSGIDKPHEKTGENDSNRNKNELFATAQVICSLLASRSQSKNFIVFRVPFTLGFIGCVLNTFWQIGQWALHDFTLFHAPRRI